MDTYTSDMQHVPRPRCCRGRCPARAHQWVAGVGRHPDRGVTRVIRVRPKKHREKLLLNFVEARVRVMLLLVVVLLLVLLVLLLWSGSRRACLVLKYYWTQQYSVESLFVFQHRDESRLRSGPVKRFLRPTVLGERIPHTSCFGRCTPGTLASARRISVCAFCN